jgi:hypothetical protein
MSHRLQVLVPEALEARLKKAAARSRVSKGEWVREAIEEKFARDAGTAPADPLAALSDLEGPTADIDDMLAQIEAGRS